MLILTFIIFILALCLVLLGDLFHLAEFREGGEAGEKPRRRVEKGRKALQTEHTRKPGEGIRCAYFREENREVKHRGVRFREQREGCRGPQGRSWNSGSGTGGPVQAAGCSRARPLGLPKREEIRKRRDMEKRKGTGATLGREGKRPRQRNTRSRAASRAGRGEGAAEEAGRQAARGQ